MASGNNQGDLGAHSQTYSSVMTMLKWGSLIVAIITAIVIMIIAR